MPKTNAVFLPDAIDAGSSVLLVRSQSEDQRIVEDGSRVESFQRERMVLWRRSCSRVIAVWGEN